MPIKKPRSGLHAPEVLSVALAAGMWLAPAAALAQDAELTLFETFVKGANEALSKGDYAEGERLLKAGLTAVRKVKGQKQAALRLSQKLADLYVREGKLDLAEPLVVSAVSEAETLFGPDSLECADARYNLAVLRARSGRLADAQSELRQALKVYEGEPGDKLAAADAYASLAAASLRQSNYGECQSAIKKALTIYDRIAGEDNGDFVDGLIVLALAQVKENKYELAEELLKRCLELAGKTFGRESGESVQALSLTALALEGQNRLSQAADALSGAASICETTKGRQTSAEARLADQQRRSKMVADSRKLSMRTLEKVDPGTDRPGAEVLMQYASLLRKLDRQEAAKKYEAKARALKKLADKQSR